MNEPKFWKRAVFWVLFCLGVGGAASWLTRDGLRAFDTMAKPPLTPPRIVFPIAWSVLLVMIGLGYALVRRETAGTAGADRAGIAFAVQMTFFFCWMIWFFGLKWYVFAAVWLAGMIVSIAAMIAVYRKSSRTAALLQIPYLLWCCFALYLNIGVACLNA